MAKIIVPGASEREKQLFEKLGISLITAIGVDEFEALVCDFLKSHNVLHLATHGNRQIRSTPLEYFSHHLNVYVFSEGGGKIANIKADPAVSFSIAEPYYPEQGIMGAVGLQVWGMASVFKKNDDPQRAADIFAHYPHANTIEEQGISDNFNEINFNVITIKPEKIRYLNLQKGFRNVTWQR